jgi:hypothetical protein
MPSRFRKGVQEFAVGEAIVALHLQQIHHVQPVSPNCCPLAKIAERDIADARYAATDALDRRLTESTRAQPHSNVFGLPERH